MNIQAFLAHQRSTAMKDPRVCEHWEMAFCVINETIFVKCMACKTVVSLKVDEGFVFTTTSAKKALEKANKDFLASTQDLGLD